MQSCILGWLASAWVKRLCWREYLSRRQALVSFGCGPFWQMVPRGLEPRTLRILAVRSNQLSYAFFSFSFSPSFSFFSSSFALAVCNSASIQATGWLTRLGWLNEGAARPGRSQRRHKACRAQAACTTRPTGQHQPAGEEELNPCMSPCPGSARSLQTFVIMRVAVGRPPYTWPGSIELATFSSPRASACAMVAAVRTSAPRCRIVHMVGERVQRLRQAGGRVTGCLRPRAASKVRTLSSCALPGAHCGSARGCCLGARLQSRCWRCLVAR